MSATVRPFTTGVDEPATVTQLPPITDLGVSTGEVRLSLHRPESLPLDTPVSVEIVLDVRRDALVVPAAAIQRDAALVPYVMVVEDGVAWRRNIETGLAAGDRIQASSGVVEGDVVVTSGLTEDSDGLPVTLAF